MKTTLVIAAAAAFLVGLGLAGSDEYRTRLVLAGCLPGEDGSACQARVGDSFEVVSINGALSVEAR